MNSPGPREICSPRGNICHPQPLSATITRPDPNPCDWHMHSVHGTMRTTGENWHNDASAFRHEAAGSGEQETVFGDLYASLGGLRGLGLGRRSVARAADPCGRTRSAQEEAPARRLYSVLTGLPGDRGEEELDGLDDFFEPIAGRREEEASATRVPAIEEAWTRFVAEHDARRQQQKEAQRAEARLGDSVEAIVVSRTPRSRQCVSAGARQSQLAARVSSSFQFRGRPAQGRFAARARDVRRLGVHGTGLFKVPVPQTLFRCVASQ